MHNNRHTSVTPLKEFLFGAAYYPEHWTAEERRDDLARMQAAGFNTVRMAEFAWDLMEPRAGEFDLSFFEAQINHLGAGGIKTILCTPTAAPPAWLIRLHPQMLRVDEKGRRMRHGSRQHACHSSPELRQYGNRITEKMAQHFKSNPYVIGWQTDNEFFCHFRECYCENCRAAFGKYAAAKYGTIADLNRDWGTAFWSQSYTAFAEIDLPYPGSPTHENPSQWLDYKLFLSEEVIAFQKAQIAILKSVNPVWWVTHNLILTQLDYLKFTRDLDFAGYDLYPMFSPPERRAAEAAGNLDKVRSLAGCFIVPELQSGPGGQGGYLHDTPQPGEIRKFFYQCMARGADGILHFRWRTCRFGAEQYWKGILDQDNKDNRRYAEICREGSELKSLAQLVLGSRLQPEVGIFLDYGLPVMSHYPITHGLPDPEQCAATVHRAFYQAGLSVGFVNVIDDFLTFKLLILPSWSVVTGELVTALEAYVAAGGTLVITGRTGVKDERNFVNADTPPGLLRNLSGIEIEEAFRINEAQRFPNAVCLEPGTEASKALAACSLWLEILRPVTARIIGSWTSGYQQQKAALSLNHYGKGKVFYLGTYPALENISPLIPLFAAHSHLHYFPTHVVPDVEWSERIHDSYRLVFIINHAGEEKEIIRPQALASGELLLGTDVTLLGANRCRIKPYGVVIVKIST